MSGRRTALSYLHDLERPEIRVSTVRDVPAVQGRPGDQVGLVVVDGAQLREHARVTATPGIRGRPADRELGPSLAWAVDMDRQQDSSADPIHEREVHIIPDPFASADTPLTVPDLDFHWPSRPHGRAGPWALELQDDLHVIVAGTPPSKVCVDLEVD